MTSSLKRATNVVTVVGVCLLIGAAIMKTTASPPLSVPLKPGDHLQGLNADAIAHADRTLLVVVRDGCTYCARSMPFYRRIAARRAERGSAGPQFVAVVLQERDAAGAARYVASERLSVDRAVPLAGTQQEQLGVAATPTLLLVDRTGTILNVWVGQLAGHVQQEVFEAMGLQ